MNDLVLVMTVYRNASDSQGKTKPVLDNDIYDFNKAADKESGKVIVKYDQSQDV